MTYFTRRVCQSRMVWNTSTWPRCFFPLPIAIYLCHVYSCILVSVRTQQQFTWKYLGGDKVHTGATFTCPVGTSLFDDVVIANTGSHVFYLREIVKGEIHGFYYVRQCGEEVEVNHVRTAGHVRPTDDFIKKYKTILAVDTHQDVQENSGNRYSLRPRKPRPPPPAPKKRKSRGNSDAVKKKPKKSPYQYAKYSTVPGGLVDPKNSTGRKPLTSREAHMVRDHHESVMRKNYKLSGIDDNGKKYNFIYMVRGWSDSRHKWFYEGRQYNSNKAEFLPVEWFNQNHMDKRWRAKTFARHQKFWFRVPVMATPEASKKGMCCPVSIIKFYNFFGLTRLASKLSRCILHVQSFSNCCKFIYRQKGFQRHEITCSGFDPIEFGIFPALFFLQICAVDTSLKCFDNSHAICICSGFIFDANHKHPLPLNKHNLDRCCVGGTSWVFHHVSRGVAFIPGKKLKKFFP